MNRSRRIPAEPKIGALASERTTAMVHEQTKKIAFPMGAVFFSFSYVLF